MSIKIENFIRTLHESSKTWGVQDQLTAMDILWNSYINACPIDGGMVQQAEKALCPIIDELSDEAADSIMESMAELWVVYQKAAFFEGVRIGVSLFADSALGKKITHPLT